MAHWLVKSEPDAWSWDEQVAAGRKGTFWNGVRNHQAKLNLIAMKKGDRAFFYHSGEAREIVGIVEIVKASYPDPTAVPGEPWVVVDVAAVAAMPKPVTLAAVKADGRLDQMMLIRNSRLSVQPVSAGEWAIVAALGGLKS